MEVIDEQEQAQALAEVMATGGIDELPPMPAEVMDETGEIVQQRFFQFLGD